MQLESELGIQASHAEIGLPSTSRRKALARRKVTVRLTEDLYKRLSLIHISEPTRPERISYAVFCLKKNV